MRSIFARVLFAAALLLFLSSLLVFFSAPTGWLWIVAIVVGEWGHYAAVAALVISGVSFRFGPVGLLTSAVALGAAALCLSPVIRAGFIAVSLPERCTDAFADAAPEPARKGPLSMRDLFLGVSVPDVEVTEHEYAQSGRKPLKLDLYRARGAATPRPLIIVVHGGSWNGGDKKELPAINRYLAGRQYAVASINYRHAPKHPSPAAVDDVFRAIEFLRANAADLRLDTTRIILLGRSAGGQVALSAAYAGKDPAIRGVVAFYAPTDLVLGYEKPSRRGVLDSRQALENYLGGTPSEKSDQYAAASPVNFITAATPPTLLIHGGLDPIVWPIHSELAASRLEAASRPHLYLALPWATHGCDANLSGPSGQLSLYAIDRFIASVIAQ
jgi:acetyl esterase/lipase